MKVKEVVKAIEQEGWFMIRRKGIHRQYRHIHRSGLLTISGRALDELADGSLKSISEQAGIESRRRESD